MKEECIEQVELLRYLGSMMTWAWGVKNNKNKNSYDKWSF